ncbi:TRAP transporter substrate-binding protein [Endozoicomonas ascidiicola]|uniref:TRAP transporter substrate-binding protein n=1 Tax=Endozoicomonas ascidiicola TaxID=1698521 RepID=UPI000832B967|nr:TRAP transporter substrate-binding protein [Endozoicomonas ascidiicola]
MVALKKNTLTKLATAVLAVAASVNVYAATTLKLSHNQDRSHPVHKSMQHMAELVKDYTDGEVKIRIYPNAQLGTQRESLELLQNGALDMAKSNASELESFEPAYGAFNIPYLFQDRDHYYRAMNGEAGQQILSASYDKGFIGLTYYDAGARSFYTSKPINSPADLQGLKIRIQPSPTAVRMIELMGAAPTPLAYGELYTAMQQGVVDGAENNETALTTARHGEVAKFFSLDEHTMIPDVLVIGSKVWDKLPEEHQAALKKAADESMMYHKDLWTKMTEESIQEAKDKMGVEFVEVAKQPFMDAVKPMHEEALKVPAISKYVEIINNQAKI